MEFITDIAQLLQHQFPQTDVSFLPERKIRKLYQIASARQPVTDRQAVQYLYGQEARPQEKKFLMLKKELEDKLTDQLLQQHMQISALPGKVQSDFKETWNSVPAIKLWCRKQMILSEILLTYNLHQHVEKILLKVTRQAEKLLLYHILEECLLLLRQVSMLKGEGKHIVIYDEKITWLQQEKQMINKASGLYERLQAQQNSKIAHSTDLARQAGSAAATVGDFLDKSSNPFLELYYLRIRTIEFTNYPNNTGRYAAQLQTLIAEKAAFIKKHKKFRDLHHLVEIYLNRIDLCQAKGNPRSAKRYTLRVMGYQDMPWNLWLAVQEKAFGIYLKAKDYEQAAAVLWQVTQTKSSQLLTLMQQSQWYIKEAYLYYVLLHQNDQEAIRAYTPRFLQKLNFSSFDRQTVPLAADKKGYQVQVLILKTLLLLETNSESMPYHAKNLQTYYQRHLVALEDEKTKLFFQIITKAAAVGFVKSKVLPRTQELVKALEAVPHHFWEKQELVPYKDLWRIVREKID